MVELEASHEVIANLIARLDRGQPADLSDQAVTELVEGGVIDEGIIWVLDHGFAELSDLGGARGSIKVDGSIAGRVAVSAAPLTNDSRAFIPLSRRGQVIGVFEAWPADEETVARLTPVATTIANALLATVPISDVVERHQGSGALSLPATIQRRNLPLTSYADDHIEVGGRLEPAYDVAGDAVDYAVNPEGIHIAIFDAVGHGLRATMLSTLALASYRLLRRQNASLAEIAREVDEVVASYGRPGDFVTGILALIQPDKGSMEYWNAGHYPPLLIRDGTYHFLETGNPGLPFGLRQEGNSQNSVGSQPGDVVFLYSDGVVQARDPSKAAWGEIHFAEAAKARTSEGLSMNQICRQLLRAVIDWTVEPLADDASIVAIRRAS